MGKEKITLTGCLTKIGLDAGRLYATEGNDEAKVIWDLEAAIIELKGPEELRVSYDPVSALCILEPLDKPIERIQFHWFKYGKAARILEIIPGKQITFNLKDQGAKRYQINYIPEGGQ